MSMKTMELSIVGVRKELLSLPEKLEAGPAVVRVTRRGKPVLAILSWEDFESLTETMEIMSDPETMAQLRQSIQEIKEGKTIPWEEVEAELLADAKSTQEV